MRNSIPIRLMSLLIVLQAGPVFADDIAFIVNPNNPLTEVSLSELRRILYRETKYWEDGTPIELVLQPEGTSAKDRVLEVIYGMTAEQLKQFWLTKLYRGEISNFQHTSHSNENILGFISISKSGIGFLEASFVDETVRVLKIDGKLPGESGYALAEILSLP